MPKIKTNLQQKSKQKGDEVWGKKHALERSKRPNALRSSVVCSAHGSRSVSLMINSTISMACSLCVSKQQTAPWVTGPFFVINPLPTPWLGLESEGYFGCLSPARVPSPFLSGWSSFPSLFHLDIPLLMTLGADVEAPSFSFCLRVATYTFTKALCLPASISAKDKRQVLEEQTLV